MPVKSKVYLMKALQPIHIGTGGYRLERIDNKIVRDEENVPVIPGTALSGAARSFLAMETKSKCGGRSGCGTDNCLVCLTFGFALESEGDKVVETGKKEHKRTQARQGMVQLYDAKLLFFPIATMHGPVWVTTKAKMEEFARELKATEPERDLVKQLDIKKWPDLEENGYFCLGDDKELQDATRLNLGWLIFERKPGNAEPKEVSKDEKALKITEVLTGQFKIEPVIARRLICIADSLFALLVDENLEKRTSVAINPATNAADEGALFTYEAVPPTAYFYSTITYNDPAGFVENEKTISCLKNEDNSDGLKDLFENVNSSSDNFEECFIKAIQHILPYFKFFGVGGLTTRGFGRLEIREV